MSKNIMNPLVAIDIGTTKICVLMAQAIDENNLEILAIGQTPSLGMARGIVVDVKEAAETIKLAIKEAEIMSGIKIENASIGISGSHIQSVNSHGIVPIRKEFVRPNDIEMVINAAKAVALPEGQQILHVLPQYFIIDGQRIADPLNMFGVRLEARVHIITGSVASVQNLVRCCQMADILVDDVILEPLASAESVLSEDEKKLGIALLDIGGGTADFAIYQQGSIRHTKVFPIAGNLITNDIALCLRTTLKDAERIKKEYGKLSKLPTDYEQRLEIELVQGQQKGSVSLNNLINIIDARVYELLLMVKKEINDQNLAPFMPAGVVLTGGGSLLRDINQKADQILEVPTRVGHTKCSYLLHESLASPIYATGYGLLLSALKKNAKNLNHNISGPLINKLLWRMKTWVSDFF